MILIVPREFLTSTRAKLLRELLYRHGTITDIYDFGDNLFFKDAAPNFIIFRYHKNNYEHKTNFFSFTKKKEFLHNSSLLYLQADSLASVKTLSNFFDVKVGLVTGLNEVFLEYPFETEFKISIMCSDFYRTNRKKSQIFLEDLDDFSTLKDIDSRLYNYMLDNKELLINRRISSFDESNWYKYGAVRNKELMETFKDKVIYVNQKTRQEKPFFCEEAGYYDGSILCLYPKMVDIDIEYWVTVLNKSKELFKEQGLYVDGRYMFTVKTLSDFIVNELIGD